METETTLAAGIRAADEETRYDAVCKELLSEKVVLAWILKTCAVEFAEYDVNEIAEKFIEGTPGHIRGTRHAQRVRGENQRHGAG